LTVRNSQYEIQHRELRRNAQCQANGQLLAFAKNTNATRQTASCLILGKLMRKYGFPRWSRTLRRENTVAFVRAAVDFERLPKEEV